MRKLITIGELSKMVGTSTYNIRYYEKEGLIKANVTTEADYRLYDEDAIYRMNMILLLRECEIPLKAIKVLLENFSIQAYQENLSQAEERIQKEINRLKVLQKTIHKRQIYLSEYGQEIDTIGVKHISERFVYHIHEMTYNEEASIKKLYDKYKNYSLDTSEIFKKVDTYILNTDGMVMGFLDNQHKYDLICSKFDEGEYLTYRFIVNSEADYLKKLDAFQVEMNCKGYKYLSEVLLEIDPQGMLLGLYPYIAELQVRIK